MRVSILPSLVTTALSATAVRAFSIAPPAVHHLINHNSYNKQQQALQYYTTSTSTTRLFSTTSSPMDFTKQEIANNDVVVFSKSYCPYCKATKSLLLDDLNIEAKVYELDQMDDGSDIQAALLEISGQRTVPNVFVKGKHLGGNDKTQAAAKSGQLKEMME